MGIGFRSVHLSNLKNICAGRLWLIQEKRGDMEKHTKRKYSLFMHLHLSEANAVART